MLIICIFLFFLAIISMTISKVFNEKAVLIKDNVIYEIKDKRLYEYSVIIATISVFIIGSLGGVIFTKGLLSSALLRQNGIAAVLITISVAVLLIGHKALRSIRISSCEQKLWNFWTAMTLFVILLGVIAVGIQQF